MRVLNVEHKSAGTEIGLGSPFWKKLTLDSQISVYDTGVRSLGHEPVGTLYDVVRKVGIRPYLATPETDRRYTQEKSKACPECKKKNGAESAPHRIEIGRSEGEPGEAIYASCAEGRVVTSAGGELYAGQRAHDETPDEFRERVRAEIATAPEKYYQRGIVVRLADERVDAAADAWELAKQIRESQLENRWPRNPEACQSYGSFCPYWSVCTGESSIDDETLFQPTPPSTERKHRLPILSVSAMRSYRSCQRKYFFAYERRLRPVSDAIALRFGTVFHKGLEVWWTTLDIDAALGAMRAAYAKHKIDHVDAIKAEELMRGYHVRWIDEPLSVVAVEAEFVAPLVNPKTGATSKTWELAGKIDAVVEAA